MTTSDLPREWQRAIDKSVDCVRDEPSEVRLHADWFAEQAQLLQGPAARLALAYAQVLRCLVQVFHAPVGLQDIEHTVRLEQCFEELNDLHGTGLAIGVRLIQLRSTNQRLEAIDLGKKRLEPLLHRMPLCPVRVMMGNSMSVVASDMGNLDMAAQWAYTAMRDAQSLGLHAREAHISANICELLYMSGNSAEALDILARAQELSALAPSPWLTSFLATTGGLCHLADGNLQAARAAIAPLVNQSDEEMGKSAMALVWFLATAGLVLTDCGELDAARVHIDRAHAARVRVTERQLSPYTWWASGHWLRVKGQPDQAIEHLEAALRESAESGYSFMPMKAAQEIYEIELLRGNTLQALKAHQRFHDLHVRVNDQSGRLKLQLLRTGTELASAKLEAERHQEMAKTKSRFIAMASHEFRTPLAAIQSSVELLRHYADRMDAAERERLWDELDGSFTRLKLTMEQVLVLSKSEAGKLPVNLLPTGWWRTTQDVVAEVQRAFATRNRIELVCKDQSLRSQTAMLDVSLFRQALGNLVSNACKYSAEAQVVRVDCWRENLHEPSMPSNWLVIEVADSGLGIHSNDHERLFALFERGRNTEHISGTGLGLAIVKRAVDAMDGQVGFESELGRGSVFTLKFRL